MGAAMSSTDCCHYCCYPCIQCCCKESEKKKSDPHAHVTYSTPEQAKAMLEKKFEFQQPQSEYLVHPQMVSQVITEQPRVVQRVSTPESSDRSSSSHGTMETIPTLQFSLYYDIQRRCLSVHLHQAFNLPVRSQRATSDPFVVIFLQPSKEDIFESKIMEKTLNPLFDQVFEFSNVLPQEIRRQSVVFRVYDHGRFSPNELIGVVMLSLEEADLYGVSMKMRIDERVEKYKSDSKGDLLFSLTYLPSSRTIQGILLKATNLQKQDITGTADPYVKVYLVHKGRKHSKWKSTTKKNTLLPVFNEPFQFDISNLNIQDISLEFVVMDYDRFSKDEIVGHVQVGPSAKEEMGRTHWDELISSPNQLISRWHTILSLSHEEEKEERGGFF